MSSSWHVRSGRIASHLQTPSAASQHRCCRIATQPQNPGGTANRPQHAANGTSEKAAHPLHTATAAIKCPPHIDASTQSRRPVPSNRQHTHHNTKQPHNPNPTAADQRTLGRRRRFEAHTRSSPRSSPRMRHTDHQPPRTVTFRHLTSSRQPQNIPTRNNPTQAQLGKAR
jgi:hypothetical protein